MSETKDRADLERVLRDIAKGAVTPEPAPRDRYRQDRYTCTYAIAPSASAGAKWQNHAGSRHEGRRGPFLGDTRGE